MPGIQKAVNKHGGKCKTSGVRGENTRQTRSSGKNVDLLESKLDILEDDNEESKKEKNNKLKEEEEVDKNKGRKQTAHQGKHFSVGRAAGQIRKMPPKIKECKIALSQQDTVKLDEVSEEKSIKKTKLKKGAKVVDNNKENDMKKEEINQLKVKIRKIKKRKRTRNKLKKKKWNLK